jgi:hypothetical protein
MLSRPTLYRRPVKRGGRTRNRIDFIMLWTFFLLQIPKTRATMAEVLPSRRPSEIFAGGPDGGRNNVPVKPGME